ncbi:hypothetical protein [Streptomyces sp. NRRL S-241]|uniref:hypothetical protein n=1 Tax=Streptomyces sp. NRRL S-241 TaxID=1463896 RepID=UPI0004BF878E|nr:hypothetical protein [Streptomyces sp. NRRL S-241]
MAFPQTPIELLAEMQIGGVWVDITGDLYARSPLTIERGRPDEAARVDPTKVSFQLNNRGNKYSLRNPRSSNYGLLGRNTPVRFSVPGLAQAYLSLDGQVANTASTPDHASFAVTDLDLRAEVTMDWTTPGLNQTIMGQWGADGNRGWTWRILNGQSAISWTTAGTSATQVAATLNLPPLPYRAALRTTLDVNNGAGGGVVSLYQAATLDGPWTLISSFTYVGTPAIFNSTAPLEIGPTQAGTSPLRRPFAGRGHRFQMMSSIGGSVVAAPDFRGQSPGTTSFADSAGRTWTLNGAASISNRTYRVHAEASTLPPRWDVSGTDVYVPVEAAGMMRRLGQGSKALSSTLRRRVPTVGLPVAYWPMEEGNKATQAYSPIAGVDPLSTAGFSYAADSDLAGSAALPRINNAASMQGNVPAHTATGVWMVAMVYRSPSEPATETELLEFTTTGTARRIRLTVESGSLDVNGYNAAGTNVFSITVVPSEFHGQWNRLDISAVESGGNVTYDLAWAVVDGQGYNINTTIAGTAGTVTAIDTQFGPLAEGFALGHLGVFASTISDDVYRFGDNGWNGETADSRHTRLCKEEGIPSSAASLGLPATAMGPQRPDTLLALLHEGALADGGILLEERERLALHFRPRHAYFNQAVALTLDYATGGHIAPPLEPVDDDQRVRNDRTVTRRNGSSARAVDETSALSTQAPPLGVGTYDDEITLNLHNDSQPPDAAGWALHMGTWDEARYPTVHINLAAAPSLVPAVLALEIGDRIQIINPPTWLPPGPIDLIVEGYTETIGHPIDWDIVLNCSPAGMWSVGVLDDTTLGRADTAGAQLASGITTTATSLSIATTSGQLWSTSGSEVPFNVEIGGEVITITAVSGASSPQTATATRSVNGIVKAHSSGADVRLAQPMILSL